MTEKDKHKQAYELWKTLPADKERYFIIGRQFEVSAQTVKKWETDFGWHGKASKELLEKNKFDDSLLDLSYQDQNKAITNEIVKMIDVLTKQGISGKATAVGTNLKSLIEVRDMLYQMSADSEEELEIFTWAKKPLSDIEAEIKQVEKDLKELRKMIKSA